MSWPAAGDDMYLESHFGWVPLELLAWRDEILEIEAMGQQEGCEMAGGQLPWRKHVGPALRGIAGC